MAIYHQHIKVLTRSKGHSAIKAIAYRRGIKLVDPITGEVHDYSRKKNVIHSEIILPFDAPQWIQNIAELQKTNPVEAAQQLANSIELKEKRKDSQLMRETEISLPIELNEEQNIALCRDFISFFTEYGMVAEFSIHWERGNPHAHILLSMRELLERDWGNKVVSWNDKEIANKARAFLAEVANKHLALAGFDNKISHLSNVALGINQEPTLHQGSHRNLVNQQARLKNKEIRLRNLQKLIDNPTIILDKLELQRADFNLEDLSKILGTQLEVANQEAPFSPPPTTVRQRFQNHLTNFLGGAAPQWLQPAPNTSLRTQLQEVSSPVLEIVPNSTPHQVMEQVLEAITKHESVFTESYLTKVLSQHINNPSEVAKILLQIKELPQLMSIGVGEDGRERYTTRDMFELENDLQTLSEGLNGKAKHVVSSRLINQCIKEFKLKNDQAKAIRYLLKGADITCLVGRAGTGKSYSLNAARFAWEKAGYTVHGVSLAGIAAENLEQDSGIKSRTIESWAHALAEQTLVLNDKDIIVMDEAGMTDALSMSKVMTAVWKAKAKLVLVGDHAQLQPIGPGAIFRAMLERVGFAELTTIRRQKESWQREATSHFAAGSTEKALEYYEKHGHIHLLKTRPIALETLIQDWYFSVQGSSLKDNLILAYKNDDVETLNQLAREKILSEGKLSPEYLIQTSRGEYGFAVGERVLFLENNWRYKLKNGQRGTIQNIITNHQNEITQLDVQLDSDKVISFNPAQYNKFAYGYACTVHRAQGLTVNNAFVFVSGFWNKSLTYVAMTRHKVLTQLYGYKEKHPSIKHLKTALAKGSLKDSVLDYPLAFAARRGIDVEASPFLHSLKKHLTEKLSWMTQSLKNNFEQTFFPEQYWEKKKYSAFKAQEIEETLKRREDAKLVAAYVDANCAVGAAFEALRLRKEILEITNETDIKYAMVTLRNEATFINFKEALKSRDAIAHNIYSEHGNYTKALALYDISLEKLLKESNQHSIRQTVNNYLLELSQGRIVHRDKLASNIQENIKTYYPVLLDNGVDVKALKSHARQHQKLKLLKQLPFNERLSFKNVEQYRAISQQAAQLWNQIKISDATLKGSLLMPIDNLSVFEIERLRTLAKIGTPISRATLIKAQGLNLDRNALAFKIYQHIENHQVGLNFYQIGIDSNQSQSIEDNQQETLARRRLERLIQQATQHELKAQSQDFLKKYLNTHDESRYEIAAQIIENKNSYYQAIFALNQDPLSMLRTLHQDNRVHQRLQLLNRFSQEEKAAFLKVEAYVEAKRAVSKIWVETKESSQPEHSVSKDILNRHQVLRDALAFAITKNPEAYESALDFFKLNLAHVDKNAFYHQTRRYCYAFKVSVGDLKTRVLLARRIISNRSAYAIVKEDSNLSWHQLQCYADYAIKQERLRSLSPLEKEDYQTALKYKRLRQKAGKLWSAILQQKNAGLEVSDAQFEKAIAINAKRNEVAYLMKANDTRFDEFLFSAQVQARDILKHAAMHEKALQNQKEIERIKSLSITKAESPSSSKTQKVPIGQYWDINMVLETLSYRAEAFATDLLGPPIAKTSTATHYRYGSKKGSLNVTIRGEKAGLWYDFATGEGGNFISLIRRELHLDFISALQYAAEWSGIAPEKILYKQKPKVERKIHLPSTQFTPEQLEKIDFAKDIIKNSINVQGTLAERYLKEKRGIIDETLFKNFRFNHAVWEKETRKNWPALVAIAHNSQGEVQSAHCIYLDPETAAKLAVEDPKCSFGPTKRASVLIQEAIHIPQVGYQYAISEGPETALSVAQSVKNLGVYTTLGVSNFANVTIPPRTKDILICADNDGNYASSNVSLTNAINSLSERGLNVFVAKPEDCKDFNDVLLKHGENEVKRLIDNKHLVKNALTLELLIENKENLVSDNAKIIVEFETKRREHEQLKSPETLEEVKRKAYLFKEIGELAVAINQDQGLLKEITKRHKVDLQVHKITSSYKKHQLFQEELTKIMQENESKNPIEEYLNIKAQKQKDSQNWANGSEAEKIEWKKINKKEEALAFIIDNTSELNYQAKQQGLSIQVRRDSQFLREKINQAINLSEGLSIRH